MARRIVLALIAAVALGAAVGAVQGALPTAGLGTGAPGHHVAKRQPTAKYRPPARRNRRARRAIRSEGPTTTIRINFQPAAAAVPSGYRIDSGQAFSSTRHFGWVTQTSLSNAVHTPVNLTTYTRDRNLVVDQRLDTFIHMQYPVGVAGAWEYALGNGSYRVTVAVGDAADYFDSVDRIRVEGTVAIPGFVPIASNHFAVASTTVTVRDGRLTVDAIGGTNTKLDFVQIMPSSLRDAVPPAVPSSVSAAPGDRQVQLSWAGNTEPDLAGYNVYRSTSLPVPLSKPLNPNLLAQPGYLDTGLGNGSTYYYVVEAVDTSGNKSDANPVSASPVDLVPPTAPSGVSASAGDGQVQVRWDANSEPDLAGYNLYRSTSLPVSLSKPLNASPLAVPGYLDTGLTNGTTYYYVVEAVDTSGNRSDANPVSARPFDTVPPAAPGGVSATAGDGQVQLGWSPNGEADLAGYNVYRATSLPVPLTTPLNPGLLAQPSYLDIGLANGTTYYYVVEAVDTSGNKADSSSVSAKPASAATTIAWSKVANAPLGRHEAGAAVVDGKLYVLGGYLDTTYVPTKRADVYDPSTDTWSRIADLPEGLTHMGVTVVGRSIYTAGGYPPNNTGTAQLFATTDVWKYDVDTNTWSGMPSLPGARGGGALVALNGTTLHFFGGSDSSRADTADHWTLAPGATSWTAATPLPHPRNHLGGVALAGRIYAVGGQTGQDAAATTSAEVDAWNPASDQWSRVADLPSARSHVSAATFVLGGRIVVIGGELSYNNSTTQVAAYDPVADGWTQLTPLPVARNSGSAGAIGGAIFYASGLFSLETYKGTLSALPPPPGGGTEIDVNFQSETASVPSGYVRDFGEPYGPHAGTSLTYGWVVPGTSTPVSLVGNGRQRGISPDGRLDTLVHMQRSAAGSWEVAVPNGTYEVTVAVGDSDVYVDSSHSISVEGTPLITGFVPTSPTHWQIATTRVDVSDGRLTISADGGTNTKIDFATIVEASSNRPYVTRTTPASGATNVNRDSAIVAELKLPNVGYGVDPATLTPSTVHLVRMSDGTQIDAALNTSGNGDTIVLQPKQTLDATTSYRFEVSGVKDLSGASLLPYTTTFTTGTATTGGPAGGIGFQKIVLPATAGQSYTSLAFGPDGKLYASTLDGLIYRFAVNADGTLGSPQVISSVQTANGGKRTVIGLAFDPSSTASNLILWVSNNAYAFANAPDWSGKITRLSGPDLATVQDYVVGLPRSVSDHMTNSLAFGPDGALYVTQGSDTGNGAPDTTWGNRPEHLLNAAVLRMNLSAITSPPLNVQTESPGTYDPFAAGVPLTIYASGLRNAYDLVWDSNGQLYVPTNGSQAGNNTPGTPSPIPSSCQNRLDSGTNGAYTGPAVPALTNIPTAQDDFLFRVVKGGYYGHPNPARCEWVLNGGNPTAGSDPAEVPQYPVGTAPDRNWRGFAYDFGLHYSPDGAIEYKSNAFNGALHGKLLVVRYSAGDDIVALTPGGPNLDITSSQGGIPGFTGFTDPIDLAENPDGSGKLYVSELGAQKITLLRPVTTSPGAHLELQNLDGAPFSDRLVFNRIGTLASPPGNGVHDRDTLRLNNTGTGPLTVTDLTIAGPWQLDSPPTLPTTIPAGSSLDVHVRFVAESGRVTTGSLTIQSDDPSTPTRTVDLAGYWQSLSENGQEPTLAEIVQLMGYKTALTSPGQPFQQDGFVRATGDEVLSPYWVRPDPTQPITVRQLNSFHSCPNTATLAWYDKASGASNGLFTSSGSDCQSLLPRLADLSGPAAGSFTPSGTFGFQVDGAEWSDPTKTNTTPDFNQGCPGPCGHHMRFWAVKDRSGNVIPNTWLMAMDYAGFNYDFNDNVYLISNMKPEPQPVLYRLDVAGTSNYTDTAGNVWTPDTGYFTPTNAAAEGANYPITAIQYTNDAPIFQTYRANLGNIPIDQRVLEYQLPVSVSRVNVRLLYAERYWSGLGQRVFNVDVEGTRVSTNFDIYKQAPGANAALVVPVYHVPIVGGVLTIDFRAVADYVAINGIEVTADP